MTTMHSRYQNASTKRGFTLIELLVVIGIIAILSSIILVSLNSARGKGNDAAIKSNLATLATQAEYYYHNNSFYSNDSGFNYCDQSPGTDFFQDKVIGGAMRAAVEASPNHNASCVIGRDDYVIEVERPTGSDYPSPYWCVDSGGAKCGVDTLVTGVPDSNGGYGGGSGCPPCTVYK